MWRYQSREQHGEHHDADFQRRQAFVHVGLRDWSWRCWPDRRGGRSQSAGTVFHARAAEPSWWCRAGERVRLRLQQLDRHVHRLRRQRQHRRGGHRSVGKGSSMYADGNLDLLGEDNVTGLAEAGPGNYIENGRFRSRNERYRRAGPSSPRWRRWYIVNQELVALNDIARGHAMNVMVPPPPTDLHPVREFCKWLAQKWLCGNGRCLHVKRSRHEDENTAVGRLMCMITMRRPR